MVAERNGVRQAADIPTQKCAIPNPDVKSTFGDAAGPRGSFLEYFPSRRLPLRDRQRSSFANDPNT